MNPNPARPTDIEVPFPAGMARANCYLRFLYLMAITAGAALACWHDDIEPVLRFMAYLVQIAVLTVLGRHAGVWPRRTLSERGAWCFAGLLVTALVFKVFFLNHRYVFLAQDHPWLPDKPMMLLFWVGAGLWWRWSCNNEQGVVRT
ncbi:hypothetical protein [Verrucomicrobium spinosum]|uniref:hypothetical protein n=1 Tax=Verrucomicrobium spinosum TaxID=2736 RepID=UPI0012F6B48E|nr:hypothetical protein [Verrucomicrobium spinosum]